jgi:hypothetical protein
MESFINLSWRAGSAGQGVFAERTRLGSFLRFAGVLAFEHGAAGAQLLRRAYVKRKTPSVVAQRLLTFRRSGLFIVAALRAIVIAVTWCSQVGVSVAGALL